MAQALFGQHHSETEPHQTQARQILHTAQKADMDLSVSDRPSVQQALFIHVSRETSHPLRTPPAVLPWP